MSELATKTVKSLYGDTYVVYQRDYDNVNKTLLRIIETTNLNALLNADEDSKIGCIHRENIVLDDTVGFQVVNDKGDYWEHESVEIIKLFDDASLKLVSAIHREPDAGWKSVQIANKTIEKAIFI